jgi:hypothetical protein
MSACVAAQQPTDVNVDLVPDKALDDLEEFNRDEAPSCEHPVRQDLSQDRILFMPARRRRLRDWWS